MAPTVYTPPTPTYTPIATITLASTDTTITFTSIPTADYRDLVLVIDGTASSGENIALRFNSDTGSNYSYVQMNGNGSTTSSNSGTETFLRFGAMYTGRTMNRFQFQDYSATDKHKTVLGRCDAAGTLSQAIAGRWASTSAITSIEVDLIGTVTFSAGTTLSLYGIEA